MIKRLETHFLISVLLVFISGLNVTSFLIEHRFTPSFSAKKAELVNHVVIGDHAQRLYAEFLKCMKVNDKKHCVLKIEAGLYRVNSESTRNSVKQLVALAKVRKDKNSFPTLTISTLGFAIACLYCAFIILSLQRNSKP